MNEFEKHLITLVEMEDKITKKIHSLMKDIKNVNKHDSDNYQYHISAIKKIDGIPVIVFIKCHNRQQLILKIESKYICNCSIEDNISYFNTILNEDYEKVKENFLFSGIVELLNILQKLKFDKLQEKFTTEDNDYFDDLFEFDNIQTIDKGECCVCYDMTITRTPCCSQFLCYKCNEAIPIKETDDDIYRSCPMCRKNIIYINKDYNFNDYQITRTIIDDDDDE